MAVLRNSLSSNWKYSPSFEDIDTGEGLKLFVFFECEVVNEHFADIMTGVVKFGGVANANDEEFDSCVGFDSL